MIKRIIVLLIGLFVCLTSWGQMHVHNDGVMQMHTDANMAVKGDISNNGTFSNNLGKLWLNGTSQQKIEGTNTIQVNNLQLNNSAGLKVDNELQLSAEFTFVTGMVLSDRADSASEFVHFLAGASYSNSSNSTHIDGVVKKTGNTAFDFPIGDNGQLMPISITAPTNVTDEFRAYYSFENPFTANVGTFGGGSYELPIQIVSTKEYWILDRTSGNAAVKVSLNWNASSEVEEPLDLLITHWDGNMWRNEGGANIIGNTTSGSLQSANTISSFSPFTLASSSTINSLPIELLSFNAIKNGDHEVKLIWTTASEVNNDYFTIERSTDDGKSWDYVGELNGAGNSVQELHYTLMDYEPLAGQNYYRLKQTDFDGKFTYSEVRMVEFDGNADHLIKLYPNPATQYLTIEYENININQLQIFDEVGRRITENIIVLSGTERANLLKLDISKLKKGTYYLKINELGKLFIVL